jgi:uncharacterized membrane protein HdeD (DUF308 family)
MIFAIPLTIVPLIAYNLIAFAGGGADSWSGQVFAFTMISGVRWAFTLGDLMIVAGIVCLFFEMLKSTNSTSRAILNHVFSTIVLIVYIVEFIVVGAAAHSVFFILTVIALFDVIAGFTITIRAASRDVALGRTLDGGP